MKSLFCIFLCVFGSTAMACPNLSGDYVKNSDGTDLSIVQEGCARITYVLNDGKVSYLTDGQEHLMNKFKIENSDGDLIANVEIYQSKKFAESILKTAGRSETLWVDDRRSEIQKASSDSYLDENKNLITITYFDDGTSFREVYLRAN